MAFIHWNRDSFLHRLIFGVLIVGLVSGGAVWAQPMMQAPRDQKQDEQRPGDQKKNTTERTVQKAEAGKAGDRYPTPGVVFNNIPGDYDTVYFGQHEYIFHEGVFYFHDPGGFRVVDPPRGVIVRSLPVGFETLLVAGVTYFVFSGVYYNQAATGYVVVAVPPEETTAVAEAVAETGKALTVDAALLNVRSGPGLNHSVVSQVRSGDTLTVQGTSGEWYYVALPDGSYGWVMAKFTRQLFPDAQG